MYQALIIFLADYLILIFGGFVLYRIIFKRDMYALVAFGAAAIAWYTAEVLKVMIDDPRPYIAQGITPLLPDPPTTGSFPSGHTSASFAMATVFWLHNRRWGAYLFILPVCIGIARIAAYVHWTRDIMGGMVIGFVLALIADYLATKMLFPKYRKSRIDT